MRLVVVVITALLLGLVFVDYSYAGMSCNQYMYDLIYETLLRRTLDSDLTDNDIKYKNSAIENLRRLCNNQKFSLEKGHTNGISR